MLGRVGGGGGGGGGGGVDSPCPKYHKGGKDVAYVVKLIITRTFLL